MTKEGFYGIVKSEWEKRKRGLTDVTEKPWNDRWKITADWQEICSVEIKAEREDCRMDVPGNQGLLYEKIHFPKRQTSGRSGGYCVWKNWRCRNLDSVWRGIQALQIQTIGYQ